MIQSYHKKQDIYLSEHFNSTMFDCHCIDYECTETLIDELLIESLELFWQIAGAFTIDSGFRCAYHNQKIGGQSNSFHIEGKAADCKSTRGLNGQALARYAEKINPFFKGGIGMYETFCHVDTRGYPARWKNLSC